MATNIGSLATTFIARTKPFESGVHRANRSMKGMRNQTMAVSASLKNMARTAIATIGAYAGFHAIRSMFVGLTQDLDKLAKTSAKLGMEVQELRQIQFLAQLSGIEVDVINKAMEDFLNILGQAESGSKGAQDAFKNLGLEFEALAAMNPAEAFKEVIKAISALPTHAQKIAALRQMFGEAGAGMMAIANMTAAEIDALGVEFDELGGTVSGASLAAVEQYNDSLIRLSTAFASLKIQITIIIATAFKPLIKWMTELAKTNVNNAKTVSQLVIKYAAMATTFLVVIAIIPKVVKAIKMVVEAIRSAAKAQATLKSLTEGVVKTLAALAAAALVGAEIDAMFEKINNKLKELEEEAKANIKVDVDDSALDGLEARLAALNTSVSAVIKGTTAEVSARTRERQTKLMVKLLEAIAGNTADAADAIAGLKIPAAPVAGIA